MGRGRARHPVIMKSITLTYDHCIVDALLPAASSGISRSASRTRTIGARTSSAWISSPMVISLDTRLGRVS